MRPLVPVLVLSAALAGCGGGSGAAGGSTSAGSIASSAPTDASATAAGSPEDRLLQRYLEVFAVADAGELRSTWIPLTAPGSLARLYSEHHTALRQAMEDSGNAPPREDTVEPTPDGVQICTPSMGDACRTYTHAAAAGDLLTSFSVNGESLAGRVAQPGARAVAGGLAVELVSGYETPRRALFVCVKAVNSSAGPVSLNAVTAALVIPGEQEQTAAFAPGPLDPIAPGAEVVACPVFEVGRVAGVLRFGVTDAAGSSSALELPVSAAEA